MSKLNLYTLAKMWLWEISICNNTHAHKINTYREKWNQDTWDHPTQPAKTPQLRHLKSLLWNNLSQLTCLGTSVPEEGEGVRVLNCYRGGWEVLSGLATWSVGVAFMHCWGRTRQSNLFDYTCNLKLFVFCFLFTTHPRSSE